MSQQLFRYLVLCAVCLAIIAVGLATCGKPRRIPDARQAATEFFLKIGESRFQEAYDSAAFSFQAQTSFRNFQATAKDLGLTSHMIACRWNKQENAENETKLVGEVVSENGKSVPVTLRLIQERGEWRVFSLRTPIQNGMKEDDPFTILGKDASFQTRANREVPAPKILRQLARDSIQLLDDALLSQNFDQFYSQVSLAWQSQLTVSQLKRDFQPFIDAKVEFHGVRSLEPVFDIAPEVNSDGILTLKGHFETRPYRLGFTFRYIYEFPYWKLYGVEVQLRPG